MKFGYFVDYEKITQYLVTQGYDASLETLDNSQCITVHVDVGESPVELVHFESKEFTEIPPFLLRHCSQYGTLAHVLEKDQSGYGLICVGDGDSISVNYEQPHLALEASLQRHIDLISKAIENVAWNKQELVREFIAHWNAILNKSDPYLILAAKEEHLDLIQVYKPVNNKSHGYGTYYLGIADHVSKLSEFSNISLTNTSSRTLVGKGYVIPLGTLVPPPIAREGLGNWCLEAISALPSSEFSKLERLISRTRSRHFWIVFNGDTTAGTAWFGVSLNSKSKAKSTLPITHTELSDWSIKPIQLTVFNKERVLPRSGANPSLSEKSVLLVGCGSVGGEIAYKLPSSGVGKLCLVDPDEYSLDNLYRHVLDGRFVGEGKSFALSRTIQSKYPWTKCEHDSSCLLDLRHQDKLETFDLMIIAIGSPTHERLFHDFLVENRVPMPVINAWVEGYGVGGHATLDISQSKGCLHCAYVDHTDLRRGLASNLNFLELNQDVTVNHAGCGDLFLPYSAVNATQTAIIASDLAIHFLNGSISKSCKISWKGDDSEALKQGLKTTHRYRVFQKSLQRLPLYDEHCDVCNDC